MFPVSPRFRSPPLLSLEPLRQPSLLIIFTLVNDGEETEVGQVPVRRKKVVKKRKTNSFLSVKKLERRL